MCVARVVRAIRASLGTGTLLKTFLLETAEQKYPLEMHPKYSNVQTRISSIQVC